jgi:hypothetical protein
VLAVAEEQRYPVVGEAQHDEGTVEHQKTGFLHGPLQEEPICQGKPVALRLNTHIIVLFLSLLVPSTKKQPRLLSHCILRSRLVCFFETGVVDLPLGHVGNSEAELCHPAQVLELASFLLFRWL